jgi:hypothetical protein
MPDPTAAPIPSDARNRASEVLAALNDTFRPLASTLHFLEEPATSFDAAEETE